MHRLRKLPGTPTFVIMALLVWTAAVVAVQAGTPSLSIQTTGSIPRWVIPHSSQDWGFDTSTVTDTARVSFDVIISDTADMGTEQPPSTLSGTFTIDTGGGTIVSVYPGNATVTRNTGASVTLVSSTSFSPSITVQYGSSGSKTVRMSGTVTSSNGTYVTADCSASVSVATVNAVVSGPYDTPSEDHLSTYFDPEQSLIPSDPSYGSLSPSPEAAPKKKTFIKCQMNAPADGIRIDKGKKISLRCGDASDGDRVIIDGTFREVDGQSYPYHVELPRMSKQTFTYTWTAKRLSGSAGVIDGQFVDAQNRVTNQGQNLFWVPPALGGYGCFELTLTVDDDGNSKNPTATGTWDDPPLVQSVTVCFCPYSHITNFHAVPPAEWTNPAVRKGDIIRNYDQGNGNPNSQKAGVLYFEYHWDTDDGRPHNFTNGTIYEVVRFPGPFGTITPYHPLTYKPPNPPYDQWNIPNPFLLTVATTGYYMGDTHSPWGGFKRPYGAVQIRSILAGQAYAWHCNTCFPKGYSARLPGFDGTAIVRDVIIDGTSFYYTISKSGQTSRKRLQ